MTREEFEHAIKALRNVTNAELIDAGVLESGDGGGWADFSRDPCRWFLNANEERTAKLWDVIAPDGGGKVAELQKALGVAQRDAASWRDSFEMYRNAWTRELGGRIFRKSHEIDALALTTQHVVKRAAYADAMDARTRAERNGIYIASKVAHADRWKTLRAAGLPITSTWIDEAGSGESKNLDDLWQRCIAEATSASIVIVYREPEENLKGAWIEVGAALAVGVPVYAIGIGEFTVAHDHRINHFNTLDDALVAARQVMAKAAA